MRSDEVIRKGKQTVYGETVRHHWKHRLKWLQISLKWAEEVWLNAATQIQLRWKKVSVNIALPANNKLTFKPQIPLFLPLMWSDELQQTCSVVSFDTHAGCAPSGHTVITAALTQRRMRAQTQWGRKETLHLRKKKTLLVYLVVLG